MPALCPMVEPFPFQPRHPPRIPSRPNPSRENPPASPYPNRPAGGCDVEKGAEWFPWKSEYRELVPGYLADQTLTPTAPVDQVSDLTIVG